MSLYKTRPFARLAKKDKITNAALKATVEEMRKGIIHVNLGGNVYKFKQPLNAAFWRKSDEDKTQKRSYGFCS